MERRPPRPSDWELKAMNVRGYHKEHVKQIHDYAREFSITHKCGFSDALSYAESFYKEFDKWEKDLEKNLQERLEKI